MATNGQQLPVRNTAMTVSIAFVDTGNDLIKGWTNAASEIFVDTAQGVVGAVPVESLDSSNNPAGYGLLNLTAAQMNGAIIGITATVSNANATATAISILTDPGLQAGVRPTTLLGYMRWLFQYFFGGGNFARGSGFQQVLNDDGSVMTTIFISGTETNFIKGKSTP